MFPIADGTVKLSAGDQGIRRCSSIPVHPARGQEHNDVLRGETDGSRPLDTLTDGGEARNDFWTAGQKNDRRHVEPRVKLYGCQATNTWMVAGKPYWRQLEQWMVAGELSGPWTAVTQFTILSDTLPDQYAWAAGGWQKFKQHQSPIFFRPEIWSSMSIQRFQCSLMTRSWWFLLWLDTPSVTLFSHAVVLSVLRAGSHHRVPVLNLDAFPVIQILGAEPKLKAPAFDILLPITLPIACSVPCAIHALVPQTNFASIGAHSVFHWQSYQHRSLSLYIEVCTCHVDVHDRKGFFVICYDRDCGSQRFQWKSPCVQIWLISTFEFSCHKSWLDVHALPRLLCLYQPTSCLLEWPGILQSLHVHGLSHTLRGHVDASILVHELCALHATAVLRQWRHQCIWRLVPLLPPQPISHVFHDCVLR